jgi:hypothetical protein
MPATPMRGFQQILRHEPRTARLPTPFDACAAAEPCIRLPACACSVFA